MDIGLVLQNDPPASRVVEQTRKAEDAGFTHVWTFESCVLWEDTFMVFPAMLAATSKVIVGPMVTNPVQRDWTVIASMFADDERDVRRAHHLRHGPRGLGASRHRWHADLDEGLRGVHDDHQGPRRGTRSHHQRPAHPPQVGDRCPLAHVGSRLRPEGAPGDRRTGRRLHPPDRRPDGDPLGDRDGPRGRPRRGRDPGAVTMCVAAPAYVGDDVAHQRDQLRWFGGMVGNHVADIVARYGFDSEVPHELTDYIKERQDYDYSHHGKADNPSVSFVPDNIVDRFCLVGPAENHIARLAELAELGVDQFALYLMHDQADETLEAYGRTVIPAVRNL